MIRGRFEIKVLIMMVLHHHVFVLVFPASVWSSIPQAPLSVDPTLY